MSHFYLYAMKILAFVDLHGSLNALKRLKEKIINKKPDIIVCAGDISIFENNLEYFIERIGRFKIPFLIIPGNHEGETHLRKACALSEYAYYLHEQIYSKAEGYLFIGYGGGGFSQDDKHFEKLGKRKFAKEIEKNKDKKIILVVHQPPYKTKVDNIGGSHAGNKSYTNFIKKNKVDLVLCGHLHENSGKEDKIRDTLVVNPGPAGKILEL